MSEVYSKSRNENAKSKESKEADKTAKGRQLRAYKDAIENYTGSDPIQLWYNYLCVLEEASHLYEKGPTIMENALEVCLGLFESEEMYKQDRRFLKILIKYIEMQENPENYYKMVYDNNTGTSLAELYICWAAVFDQRNEYGPAEEIYQLGFKKNALPIGVLKKAHEEFGFLMSQRILKAVSLEQVSRDIELKRSKFRILREVTTDTSSILQPLFDNREQEPGCSQDNYVPSIDSRCPKTPEANKSLVKTIKRSEQKSRHPQDNQDGRPQRLNFDDERPVKRSVPLHRDEFVDGEPGTMPGYDKIMLFPNENVCYSLEELTAYKWFKKKNIKNDFTREHDQYWESGYDVPIRWPPMFCRKNDPQEDSKMRKLRWTDINLRDDRRFDFDIRRLYANNGNEEYSIEEIMWKRRKALKEIQGSGTELTGEASSRSGTIPKSTMQVEERQTRMEQQAPQQSGRVFVEETPSVSRTGVISTKAIKSSPTLQINNESILKKPKRSEDFQSLNETCTTMAFNFCIKSEFVSTPKLDKKRSPTNMEHVAGGKAIDDVIGQSDFRNIPMVKSEKQPRIVSNFEVYVDENEQASYVEKARVERIPQKDVQRENHEPQFRPIEIDSPKRGASSALGISSLQSAPYYTQFRSSPNDLDISIPLTDYEREKFLQRRRVDSIGDSNKTEIVIGADFLRFAQNRDLATTSQGRRYEEPDEEIPISLEDYDNNEKFGRSIYLSQNNLEYSEDEQPEWEEVSRINQGDGPENNEYMHQQVDLDETVQYISQELVNVKDFNPLSSKFQSALLDKMGFMDTLLQSNQNVCQLVNVCHPIKPKKTISIGETQFYIQKLIGKGSYGNVFSGASVQSGETFAFKQQRPGNLWEYYICQEIQKRISQIELSIGYMTIDYAIIGNNATVFVSKFSKHGSLIDVCNKIKQRTGTNMDELIVMILASQMLCLVKHLQQARIIHGDIKPDNFLIMKPLNQDTYASDIVLQLIDFGQSIDLKLFPRGQVFHSQVKTENFICTEMLDKRPWTYHHDIFCVAGTVFTMLCGKYMNVLQRKTAPGYDTQSLPRYCDRAMWKTFFDKLINIPEATDFSMLEDLRYMLQGNINTHSLNSIKEKIKTFNAAI